MAQLTASGRKAMPIVAVSSAPAAKAAVPAKVHRKFPVISGGSTLKISSLLR